VFELALAQCFGQLEFEVGLAIYSDLLATLKIPGANSEDGVFYRVVRLDFESQYGRFGLFGGGNFGVPVRQAARQLRGYSQLLGAFLGRGGRLPGLRLSFASGDRLEGRDFEHDEFPGLPVYG